MDPESVNYTSLIPPDYHYEYLRSLFGIKNGPAMFQGFNSNVLHEIVRKHQVYVYKDDIILMTCTVEQHIILVSKFLVSD